MIQGQFDAATKLDHPKAHDSVADAGRDHTERPRKRRKTSPPIEDSINVVDLSRIDRPQSPIQRGSAKAARPSDGQLSTARSEESGAANPSRDETSLQCTAETEPVDPEQEEEGQKNPSSHLEHVSLPAESDPSRGLPRSNVTARQATRKTEIEAPGPPLVPQNAKDPGTQPQRNAQAVSAAVSSSALSRRHSPSPRSSSQDARTSEGFFRFPNGSNPSHPLPSGRNAIISGSGPETPKPSHSGTQTNTTSSPLSSPPPELFDPYDEHSTEPPPSSSRPSSPASDGEGQSNSSDDGGPILSQERVNRSQTLRRSLSTLKGRELFDASIWSDPLKTSVFYTFATNLRQKSKDAAPTGCHEFISHLSNAGKMVRCYTQNIDLLEDKVGLSTRLLLGPGSRSRFSTRLSKGAPGTSTPRNPNPTCIPPSNISDGPCIPPQIPPSSEQAVKEEGKLPTTASLANSQEAPSQVMTNVELNKQNEKHGHHEVVEDNSEQGRDAVQDQSRGDADRTTNDAQPVEAPPNNLSQPTQKADSGHATPEHDRGVECVFLHGSLRSLRCFQCGSVADWDECDREHLTLSGEQPPCPRCEDATAARQERGKRALGVGKLRPDIVLYGEEHPESQRISTIIQHDISLAPDMLIIMGTSLKVHGLKTVVREFAKAVHNKKDGKVLFINFTRPAESVWADIIDFWIEMDCDAWVQDLKAKKPIIWLPPGSVEDEPRSTKRRRTIKDEAEKKQSKKAKNIEQPKIKTTLIHTPDKEDKKPLLKATVKERLSDIKKSEPKRPAAFRDCKQNGAYWTVKIMLGLAKLSGRNEETALVPRSFRPTSPPQNSISVATTNALSMRKAAHTKHPAKVRRGPRTKNTKSRRTLGEPSATPKARRRPSGKAASSTRPEPDRSGTSTASIQLGGSEISQFDTSKYPPIPAAEIGSGSRADDVAPGETSDAAILAEVAIPNLGPETGPVGPGTSILASVKSNHRIRKPKKIFGEPASDTSSAPSGGGSKSKFRHAPQARKTKSEKSKEDHGAETDEASRINQKDQTRTLPAPPPRLQPRAAASEPENSQRQETPVESYYILPPLQHANIEHRPKHNLPPIGISPGSAGNTAHAPPDVLEPIVVPGPPVAISPTALSPNHWRNRAFTYGDPLSRHFENYYPQVRPPQNPDNPSAHSSVPGQRPQQQHALSDLFLLGATSSNVDDSPSQQLYRESREKEAAAALNDLRSQAGYDNRQFAIKPEGP